MNLVDLYLNCQAEKNKLTEFLLEETPITNFDIPDNDLIYVVDNMEQGLPDTSIGSPMVFDNSQSRMMIWSGNAWLELAGRQA